MAPQTASPARLFYSMNYPNLTFSCQGHQLFISLTGFMTLYIALSAVDA
jgi:hypothetical protein